jgi:hypothetical protein
VTNDQLNLRVSLRKNQRAIWVAALIGFTLVLLAVVALGYLNAWAWVGVIEYEYSDTGAPLAVSNIKTVWDWLGLLIVPVLLALGAFWFNRSQKQTELQVSQQHAETEREIAANKLQQEYLERYYTRMEELLLHERLRESETTSEERAIARTRTLDILRRLDGNRKGQVLQFLNDARLIQRPDSLKDAKTGHFDYSDPIVRLDEADISDVVLSGATMMHIHLYRAQLPGANLRYARLNGAYMFGVTLTSSLANIYCRIEAM